MQARSKVLFVQFGRRRLLSAGVLGVCFSFVTWFPVHGTVGLNRLLVSGLFASLATNVLLLSGMFFYKKRYDEGVGTRESVFRTPVILLSAFLPVFAIATVTAPLWANNFHLSGNATKFARVGSSADREQ